jgi:hypothetical protein
MSVLIDICEQLMVLTFDTGVRLIPSLMSKVELFKTTGKGSETTPKVLE